MLILVSCNQVNNDNSGDLLGEEYSNSQSSEVVSEPLNIPVLQDEDIAPPITPKANEPTIDISTLSFDGIDRFRNGVAVVWVYAPEGREYELHQYYYGLIDIHGNIIAEPIFDDIRWDWSGIYVVNYRGYEGLKDSDGTWILEPSLDQILNYSNGIAPFRINSKMGYINTSGETIIQPIFDNIQQSLIGTYVVAFDFARGYATNPSMFGPGETIRFYKYRVIDLNGNTIFEDSIIYLDSSGTSAFSAYSDVRNENGVYYYPVIRMNTIAKRIVDPNGMYTSRFERMEPHGPSFDLVSGVEPFEVIELMERNFEIEWVAIG